MLWQCVVQMAEVDINRLPQNTFGEFRVPLGRIHLAAVRNKIEPWRVDGDIAPLPSSVGIDFRGDDKPRVMGVAPCAFQLVCCLKFNGKELPSPERSWPIVVLVAGTGSRYHAKCVNETKNQKGRKEGKEGRRDGISLQGAVDSSRKRRKHSHLKTVRHDGSIGLIYVLTWRLDFFGIDIPTIHGSFFCGWVPWTTKYLDLATRSSLWYISFHLKHYRQSPGLYVVSDPHRCNRRSRWFGPYRIGFQF